MKIVDVCEELDAVENPADDYARTRRVLLRTPSAEFGASAYSAFLGEFIGPNRDYSHEGLSVIVNGASVKLLDALLYALDRDGQPLPLRPAHVHIQPHAAVYAYAADSGETLTTSYYLVGRKESPALHVALALAGAKSGSVYRARVKVLADVREEEEPSAAQLTHSKTMDGRLAVERHPHAFSVTAKNAGAAPWERLQEWSYKLDNGNRRETPAGPRFVRETRIILDAGVLSIPFAKNAAELTVTPAADKPRAVLRAAAQAAEEKHLNALLTKFAGELKNARETLGADAARALAGRLIVLLEKFGLQTNAGILPDAGAYWFRAAWLRDAFSALRDNAAVFARAKRQYARGVYANTLELQRNGLLPNRLNAYGQGADYQTLDATLLGLNGAFEFAALTRDAGLQGKALDRSLEFVRHVAQPERAIALDENGLLRCPANYSWMDSRLSRGGTLVPTRIPALWLENLLSKGGVAYVAEPNFFLVETNALWLKLLERTHGALEAKSRSSDSIASLRESAWASYRRLFLTAEFPPHLVSPDFGAAPEHAAPSLEALAELSSEISAPQLDAALRACEGTLFARDGNRLFGVFAKQGELKPVYGDAEYHASAVWPRSTPALLALLRKTGRQTQVDEVLAANLQHQQNDGAVFYCAELFSPDAPNRLVPVKNPAQFWSGWVQPYFERLAARA